MNHEAVCYEKALKKQLRCTSSTKKRLLQQFRGSLDTYLEDHPSPTETDLCKAFGPPEDMAEILMESVSAAEVSRFKKQQNWKRLTAIALVALLLVLMIYVFFWKSKPLSSQSEIYIYPEVTTNQEVNK